MQKSCESRNFYLVYPQTMSANFTFPIKFDWSDFTEMATKPITKQVITTYNNVSLQWSATFGTFPDTHLGYFGFRLQYIDGPMEKLQSLGFIVQKKYGSGISAFSSKSEVTLSNLAFERGITSHYSSNIGFLDKATFAANHELTDSDRLFFLITLKVPSSIFAYTMERKLDPYPVWASNPFEFLEDAKKSEDTDVRLISAEGAFFYCHRYVLRRQSEGLAGMFRHPTTEEELKGNFRFPKLSTIALQEALRCLYVGQAPMNDLPTEIVLEVCDFAEQYRLQNLKELCASSLWKRVEDKPEDAVQILRFADLYEMKYLKDRAMNILWDQYEEEKLDKEKFWLFGEEKLGEQGARLREEFGLFVYRRVDASF